MEEPEQKKSLFNMLNSMSYLRVFVPSEDDPNGPKEVKQEVFKFVGWYMSIYNIVFASGWVYLFI